jgi:hypothetical protein
MSNTEHPGGVRPVNCLASIFLTRKHLLDPLRHVVLRNSDLNLEEADLLVNLFGAAEFRWTDPPADENGFVTFRDLRQSLVHSETLLSRRLASLQNRGYVEVDMVVRRAKQAAEAPKRGEGRLPKPKNGLAGGLAEPLSGLRGNSRIIRITAVGKDKVRPIWEAYENLANQMLRGVPKADLDAHFRVNRLIQERIRPSWLQLGVAAPRNGAL